MHTLQGFENFGIRMLSEYIERLSQSARKDDRILRNNTKSRPAVGTSAEMSVESTDSYSSLPQISQAHVSDV